MTVKSGYIHGTGAAINVELGYIPDLVIITNVTDGDKVHYCVLDKVVVFTSGGTGEVKAGDTLTGATSGATAKVREVIIDSGSWAGDDAAGWFICDHEDISGTIQSENVNQSGSGTQSNIATVVVDVEFGVDIDTAVASVTGNAGCLGYVGSASNNYAKGVTIGSTISENGKLLHMIAFKNDPGEGQGPKVLGNQQSTLW
tara:strand:- start:584 stop:1183 length:600 start_codon:yes stop_codon:yes gene_type:complete